MLGALRHEVDLLAVAGVSLACIEAEVIDVAPVGEERRAALWLYAWLRVRPDGVAVAAPRLLDFAA